MKKAIFIFSASLILSACKSGKSAAPAVTVNTTPTEAQLQAVKVKFPEATMADLTRGHDLYYSTCTNCHKAKDINRESEAEWPGIIDEMAKKAKITQAEKDAVYKYVMAVKLSNKTQN